jgi:hypothetical protein
MRSKLFSILSILTIMIFGSEAYAQEKTYVSGIVTTSKNLPLNKAKVLAIKSGEIAYTDSSGLFRLQTLNKDILSVSASGFKSRKIKISKQTIYKIDLLFEDNVSNFNNAVNAGHISKTALQMAIADDQKKSGKDYSTYSSIYQLIASEIYSVTVRDNMVYNKKNRSLTSNPKVLFVVDERVVADISNISPIDVKNIEFIDDVGATMWGVQGANGVLKITLK